VNRHIWDLIRTRLTLVRAIRTVSLVAGHVEDGAFDGDVGRVVGVVACKESLSDGLIQWKQCLCTITRGIDG
jgi:hypothetical protein